MNTRSLVVVEGTCPQSRTRSQRDPVGGSIHRAIDAGFRIGRRVRIGRVCGSVIGYNIASSGRFGGASYPLLVETEFGIAKCSMLEVCPA